MQTLFYKISHKSVIVPMFLVGLLLLISFCAPKKSQSQVQESKILSYTVNPAHLTVKMFWKDENQQPYGNFKNLKDHLEKNGKTLQFAMNGGMYMEDQTPLGLFIENGETKTKMNSVQNAYGNFYLQPNGVFYLTNDNNAGVVTSDKFINDSTILYATQSGPMLLIDGEYHPKLTKGSDNLHIRNGVGILPNGDIIFALSKELINFYDLATFFKSKGCKNALYLDGFVSKAYCPSQEWNQLGGNFGPIIGVIEK